MKKNHDTLKGLLCAVMLLFVLPLTGCGRDGGVAAGGKSTEGGISRAEYIGMLGESFGYNAYVSETDIFTDVSSANQYYSEIQAAAEWQIIDSGETFEPDEAASISFALESAVRAIGTDDIAASGAAIDMDNLVDFYVNNIARINLSDREAFIDADSARQIIDYAKNYSTSLILPQITEIEFMEGVKPAGMGIWLNADGATGVLSASEGYSVGDIVFFNATDNSLARAVKITGIEGETFTFEEAPLEETYSYLNIRGTFPGKVVEAVSASDGTYVGLGQEIYDEMKAYRLAAEDGEYILKNLSNSVKVDKGSDHFVCTASFDVEKSASRSDIDVKASANGKLVVGIKNISVDIVYETSEFLGIPNVFDPKEIKCNLHFDTEISSEIHGSVSASIPLGEVYLQVGGPLSPLNIKLMLTAHLGADGNVSISYTTANVLTAGWKESAGFHKDFSSTSKLDFEADATLTAKATLLADLRVGYKSVSKSVVNAQITAGAVAVCKTEADLLGDQPTCVDLQLYVPLEWGVNQESCIITDINKSWKYSDVIWNSENSPIKLHRHLEDWVRTSGDVCTRTDAVEQELTTPEGEPLEEIDPFDFEPIDFDFIELVSYAMYLGQGESLSIGFENIPNDYTQEDLRYEVMDSAVCSVSGGTVNGKSAGSTIVKISTADGMFTVSLAVTVNDDYSVEGFQSL